MTTPTTTRHRLTGWGTFEELSVRPLLFGVLHKLGRDTVDNYQSDWYHDALWIRDNVHGPCTFYFSFDESGTCLAMDTAVGHFRDGHRFTITLEVDEADGPGKGMWFAAVTPA